LAHLVPDELDLAMESSIADASGLTSDLLFRERVTALIGSTAGDGSSSLDEVLANLRIFITVRRREVRVARLRKAERIEAAEWRTDGTRFAGAIGAFAAAITGLSKAAKSVQPLITPALDNVLVLAADVQHPLRQTLHQSLSGVGIADDEIAWLFGELSKVNFRPVNLVCTDGFDDLLVMIEAVSVGEAGLLAAGFPRLTGDPGIDERVKNLVLRLRRAGLTANFFLGLVIVIAAHLVRAQAASNLVKS
jgi:hypothetical protein